MTAYLLELYVAKANEDKLAGGADRARAAAAAVTREGSRVTYLRSIFVPEDETWLLLYEADSAAAVREAAARAGLSFERIAEARTLAE